MTTMDYAAELAAPMTPVSRPAIPASNAQMLARLTGLLFIVTFAASIPPVASLYVPALSDPAYVLGGGADPALTFGAVLEMILIVANIGTAVLMYPILKQQNGVLALGFVTARVMESCFIAFGIVALLALATLRLDATGADQGALVVTGHALVALHDWTFRLGPGFVVGIGNGLILGYLMFRSRLVPRTLAVLGLVGGPLIVGSGVAGMFGLIEPWSVAQGLATLPEFVWELTLGVWLLVKGVNPAALGALQARTPTV